MRYLALFALPLALCAQPAESGDKLAQALISELQQLRLAIERSTLLGVRAQLAITTHLGDARQQGAPQLRTASVRLTAATI